MTGRSLSDKNLLLGSNSANLAGSAFTWRGWIIKSGRLNRRPRKYWHLGRELLPEKFGNDENHDSATNPTAEQEVEQ